MPKQNVLHTGAPPSRSGPRPQVSSARVFRPCDWLAFGLVFAITLAAYTFTLAPTVTLEDSGELVVAAEHLGVPHPPGYPLWTIVAWMFTRIFGFVKYMGYPNPAWAVNFTSAFFGGLSSALVAMLVSRIGHDLLYFRRTDAENPGRRNDNTSPLAEQAITVMAGVGAGLLLSFTPLQWSQSVIAEVYTINTFITLTMLLLAFLWLQRPEGSRAPYVIALLFGLAVTNFQPIVLIVPAMMIVFFAADRAMFRDVLAPGLVFVGLWVYVFRVRPLAEAGAAGGGLGSAWGIISLLLILSPIGVRLAFGKLFTEWKRVLTMAPLAGLGLCMYIYMPLASETNPPMNWGYPRTWEGFKHVVTRGQYQALAPAVMPTDFMKQAAAYLGELELEFTLPPLLLAVAVLFFIKRIRRRERAWLGAAAAGFLCYGFGMMAILNPGHDIQSMFIARVQLLQSVAICALLIGCGAVLCLAFLESATRSKLPLAAGMAVVVMAPSAQIWRNAHDEGLIRAYGAANLEGFDFGWQFGYFQLYGAEGIARTLKPGEPPLPNPDYPPAMERDAIFFGGTDPGRFVPTYMIFSARVRPDVFLITQNALADHTYMSVMRDLYGDDIWIPTPRDTNMAFQRYVDDVRSGRIPASAAIAVDASGKVSIRGVQGVMEINGILCRMIFDANNWKHDFYIEESYVINWMYPYLEPHGLILKINNEPLQELTDEMIRNDMEFWEWYTERLLNNEHFLRSAVARKSFSKLRCAIAGLYAYRNLFDEAETAYRQAVELSPISPEANFRLADLYIRRGRFNDAYALMERNLELDPRNDKIVNFMRQIENQRLLNERMAQLQTALSGGAGTLDMIFELASIYQQTGRHQQFFELARQLLRNEDVPADAYLKIAEMHADAVPQRPDFLAEVLETYLRREPRNPRVWFDLACVRAAMGQNDEAFQALREAVAIGGEPMRELARRDGGLAPLRGAPEYAQAIESLLRRRPPPFPGAFAP